jgi:hypothetical protein
LGTFACEVCKGQFKFGFYAGLNNHEPLSQRQSGGFGITYFASVNLTLGVA